MSAVIEAEDRRVVSTGFGDVPVMEVGSGPVVLLLSGWPLAPVQWQRMLPQLAARFRVMVPDLTRILPGSLPVAALRELLGVEGIDRVSLVAQGTGAATALDLLLALSSDDDGIEPDAAVLLTPAVPGLWPAQAARDLLVEIPGTGVTDGEIGDAVASLLTEGSGEASVIDRSLFEAVCAAWEGAAGREAFTQAAAALAAVEPAPPPGPAEAALDEDRASALTGIETPVLLLWGEDDPFAPAAGGEILHDLIGSATLGLVPGCGHFLLEEAPATVVPMIVEYLHARALGGAHTHGVDGLREGVTRLQLERRPPWAGPADEDRW